MPAAMSLRHVQLRAISALKFARSAIRSSQANKSLLILADVLICLKSVMAQQSNKSNFRNWAVLCSIALIFIVPQFMEDYV